MSAESTVVFYGVQFNMRDEEITALEDRSHPLLVVARRNGLKHYWGNFATPNSKWLLFIGDKLGILGLENEWEIQIRHDDLSDRMNEVEAKLRLTGIDEPPILCMAWQPDS